MLAEDKHSSLFEKFVTTAVKRFVTLGLGVEPIKRVFLHLSRLRQNKLAPLLSSSLSIGAKEASVFSSFYSCQDFTCQPYLLVRTEPTRVEHLITLMVCSWLHPQTTSLS